MLPITAIRARVKQADLIGLVHPQVCNRSSLNICITVSGPKSIFSSSSISAPDRVRTSRPPRRRADSHAAQTQNGAGQPSAAAVPSRSSSMWRMIDEWMSLSAAQAQCSTIFAGISRSGEILRRPNPRVQIERRAPRAVAIVRLASSPAQHSGGRQFLPRII